MTRNEFAALLREGIVLLDGATGTELVKKGLPKGVCPELWIYEHPEAINSLHRDYRDAGSRIVYAPTFGANRFKLEEFSLVERLAELNTGLAARAKANTDAYVFGDLAPTGRFIEPFGDISFDNAVEVYTEQVAALLAGGVDGFVIETMIDIQETRAAIIAVRSLCDLPVMVSVTFEDDGRTLNGSDAMAALAIAQSFDIDAFGCNCSAGPEKMATWIARMASCARIPLLAKPNAGLPKLIDGKTVFDMSAEEFGEKSLLLCDAGASIIGGCCGTSPEHIRIAAMKLSGKKGYSSPANTKVLIANNRDAILVDKSLVPQRISRQSNNGAQLIAVDTIRSSQLKNLCVARTVLPLVEHEVSEDILRSYPGTLLIKNTAHSAETIRHFGHFPVLCYDENSEIIPQTFYDISDTVQRISNDSIRSCLQTIEQSGAAAICDFSKLSACEHFLLPMSVFEGLRMYMSDNPVATDLAIAAFALSGNDPTLSHLVSQLSQKNESTVTTNAKTSMDRIFECVLTGNTENILKEIETALSENIEAKKIVDDAMIPAINLVGEKYEKKIYFLPQLMLAAETMQKGFSKLESLLSKGSLQTSDGTIVLATVKGDIHDIGKNIVALMFRNYSFKVIDLGKDVDDETIISNARKAGADIIALSALMTTTMGEMKKVVNGVRSQNMHIPVMIGGAVVTDDYAQEIGAYYSRDAMEAVRTAQSLMKKNRQ